MEKGLNFIFVGFFTKQCVYRTWICEACKSIVMMWSAPATDNILATNLAEIGARLYGNDGRLDVCVCVWVIEKCQLEYETMYFLDFASF